MDNNKLSRGKPDGAADNSEAASAKAPSSMRVIWDEIKNDKLALISLFLFIFIVVATFILAEVVDKDAAMRVVIGKQNRPPSAANILGTDPSGRDMFGQLVIGARNSFLIAFAVTIAGGILGILIGLIAGFYAGNVDNVVMRFIDFFMMLPSTMIIIVLVSIIPKYNVPQFVLIMICFAWMGKARLIRAKTLQQSGLDYVLASKTLGTPNFIIMFREVLPNLVSIIVVNMTLTLASNMGLETGLSFLGFGLPFNTPSLGTLISYASVPATMQSRPWQWLPAALLVFVMMLCINFVGQAINRAADAKQRTI